MFKTKTHRTVASLMLGIACLSAPTLARAASPLKLSGAIVGIVSDPAGVQRMGASVVLYSRQDRILGRARTDPRGEFQFAGLFPDTYSIRVTLATFIPAIRQ